MIIQVISVLEVQLIVSTGANILPYNHHPDYSCEDYLVWRAQAQKWAGQTMN